MDVETEVKPWISLEEWKKVKNCLMQRKLQLAQEYINVWKIRTHKLDAGKSQKLSINVQIKKLLNQVHIGER